MIFIYRNILWDFDGTLMDTYPFIAGTFQKLLEERGIVEPHEEILRRFKVSTTSARAHYHALGLIDDAFVREYTRRRHQEELDRSVPFAGAAEALAKICAVGGANFLYTHRGDSVFALLKKHDLLRYFRDCVTGQHCFPPKPSPEAILHLIAAHAIEPDTALMIGDRDIDILAAKNAGIAACFYGAEDPTNRADYTIADLRALPSILGLA